MGAHALGAAAYAAKAAALAAPEDPTARDAEVRWQLDRMTDDVRLALSRLPALGADTAGPLGSGLLASGDLGDVIRTIQAELRMRRPAAG
ncbi:putative immunity protein, partial [uncultured Leifsonia sp.]|uniref:putative immunity protein n=1 Tax=uncultured Leifsonia sp. TaxID=340359 RepID=UPI0037DDB2EC